jgi:MFS family permease
VNFARTPLRAIHLWRGARAGKVAASPTRVAPMKPPAHPLRLLRPQRRAAAHPPPAADAPAPASARLILLPLVMGGLIVGLSMGMRGGFGLFVPPIALDRGWSRESIAFALALQNLAWGLAQPLFGAIADRFGAARVIAAGMLAYALGLFAMAHAPGSTSFTLSTGLCVGLGLAGSAFGTVYGAVARLVPPERRSVALGITGAIGGLGQFLMLPLLGGLITGTGWVTALVVMAMAFMVASLGSHALRTPPGAGPAAPAQRMGQAIGQALRERDFWLLGLGFFTCGFQLSFVSFHLPAFLADHGFAVRVGTTALALITLANIGGIYACGWLGDRYRPRSVLTALYLLRAAAFAAFIALPLSEVSLYGFAVVMGLTWLGTVPLTNGVILRLYGVRYLSTLFGFVFVGHQLGGFAGAWVGGWAFDTTGSYAVVWWACAALGLTAAAFHFPIDDTPRAPARVAPPEAAPA